MLCRELIAVCSETHTKNTNILSMLNVELSGAFAKLRKATIWFVMSFRPSAWKNSDTTGRIFMKFDISVFCERLSRKFKIQWSLTRVKAALHEDQRTFMSTSRSVLLKMRNVSDKVVEKIKTHSLCSITFFANRAVYEIMWKNMVEPDRPQITIWYGACALHAG
jgi:hypothetical protein